jgi:glycine cleavage system regulatory protein
MCLEAAMRTALVLTIIGDDKPGIVEQLSDHILAAGANWEESRMARLGGKFTGLLRVSVDADRADALAAQLRMAPAGLTVVVERSGERHEPGLRTIRLELLGHDQPGIIRNISRVLADQAVNIEELETDTTSAPMSGDTLFRARASLRVPADVSLTRLQSTLEELAGELMVDLTLEENEQSVS